MIERMLAVHSKGKAETGATTEPRSEPSVALATDDTHGRRYAASGPRSKKATCGAGKARSINKFPAAADGRALNPSRRLNS